MTLDNPTQIRLGMTGSFFGRTYRVAGRAVLGEMEGGEIYSWNEFNLVSDTGDSGTLVYEETERGGEWRWFTLFEPEFPITAQDAATKRVGDPVNLDGTDVTVTLVKESRVYHVEGTAAEGVKVGAYANYFNAEAGQKMVVVSWTGNEVECYHGVTIRSSLVSSGFNLQKLGLIKFKLTGGANLSSPRLGKTLLSLGIVLVVIAIIGYALCQDFPQSRPPAMVSYSAPDSPLKVGNSGTLAGRNYRIVGHAEVDLAEVGLEVACHEYHLLDADGSEARLTYGSEPGFKNWMLFTPLHPTALFPPQLAGGVRKGETVSVDNVTVLVAKLFRMTIVRAEEQDGEAPKPGEVRYGFSGAQGGDLLLARWDEGRIMCYHGRLVQPGEVTSAFVRLSHEH